MAVVEIWREARRFVVRARAWLWACSVVAALVAPGVNPAASAQDLARLFSEEADVYTTSAGLERLPLPAEVVRACRSDLSDLRLFDRQGREVPYLIQSGVPPGWQTRENLRVETRVLDLTREQTPREGGPARTREVYRLAFPDTPPPGEIWTLVLTTERPRFVRSLRVVGSGDDGAEIELVPRASIARLGQAHVDRDRLPLPPFSGREITVTIDGEEGDFLEPVPSFTSERSLESAPFLDVPLEILTQRHGDGKTILELERPPGPLPSRLRVTSSTPLFDRQVRIFDTNTPHGTRSLLGSGRLLRATGAAPEERLAVDVATPRGGRLEVEITDGDSPPLADLQVIASARQPALVFALAPGGDGAPAGTLRFGGDRAWPPRYDVADLFRDGGSAAAAAREPGQLPEARLGRVRANPNFESGPLLAALLRPGAPVDPRGWRWSRALSIPASRDGLASLRLTADDLARSQADLSDVRVVDADGRQWPYLVAESRGHESVALEISPPRVHDHERSWRLVVPAGPLTLDRLAVVPVDPLLDRPFRLMTTDARGDERVLARGNLTQDVRRPTPILVSFSPTRLEALDLVVSEGDDAPVALRRVEADVAVPAIVVAAPAGDYRLLLGNPDATAPSYELARARDVVLGLRSLAGQTGAAVENPTWNGTPGGTARSRERWTQVAVWAAIGIAVVVLGLLTFRVARA